MTGREGSVDARVIELLWRDRTSAPGSGTPAPGAQAPGLSTGAIVRSAIETADREGVGAVSMRRVASSLGAAAMSLYTHVPDKTALLALMQDDVLIGMAVTEPPFGIGWRERLRLVARDNHALLLRHPWLLELPLVSPPVGPGLLAKYEWELSAFRGLGLSAIETDSALSFLLGVVRSAAEDEIAVSRGHAGSGGAAWWAAVGPAISRHVDEDDYPLATRIGAMAAAVLGRTAEPDHRFRFGVDRALDGIAALVARGRS